MYHVGACGIAYKFVFFSVSENGENGLGDEGADGAMPPEFFLITAFFSFLLVMGIGKRAFIAPWPIDYGTGCRVQTEQ